MLKFILPTEADREAVTAFYAEIERDGGECIGFANHDDYDRWLIGMKNRHEGKNLPAGYVREDFFLCYDGEEMIGVFSLKYELTEYLLKYGGHIGYAVRPEKRNRGYATKMLGLGMKIAAEKGFEKLLCVCDDDNYASEKVILNNGGVLENTLYDESDGVTVKRYWVSCKNG